MWNKLVHFVTLLFFASTSTAKMELQFERCEQEFGFDLFNATGVRVRKFNRTSWIVDGEFDFFVDIGNEYSFTVTAAFSRLGNNQFNQYPLKIPKDKACNALNGPYKEYQEYFVNFTNLPRVGDEWLCPFPKGHYWVKEYTPEVGWIPPVIEPGYWRLSFDFLDSEDRVAARFAHYIRIMNSFFLV